MEQAAINAGANALAQLRPGIYARPFQPSIGTPQARVAAMKMLQAAAPYSGEAAIRAAADSIANEYPFIYADYFDHTKGNGEAERLACCVLAANNAL